MGMALEYINELNDDNEGCSCYYRKTLKRPRKRYCGERRLHGGTEPLSLYRRTLHGRAI